MSSSAYSQIRSLVELHEYSVVEYPDRPLFGTKKNGQWEWITYVQFGRMVDSLRNRLAYLGLQRGDTVALIAGNSVEWAASAYATMSLGAALVPMYESQSLEDWRYIINDCGAKILLVTSFDNYMTTLNLPFELPHLQHTKHIMTWGNEEIIFQGADPSEIDKQTTVYPTKDDIACIIYTSGTTGKPKGVELKHSNILSNVLVVRQLLSLQADDRCLSFLPWSHSFGQTCELHTFIANGAQIAICEGVDKIIDNLAEVKPTVLCAVPRIFNRIYDGVQKQVGSKPQVVQSIFRGAQTAYEMQQKGRTLSLKQSGQFWLADKLIFSKIRQKFGGRLRYAFSGGAALAKEVAKFIDMLGISVYEGYGLSETSPIVACNTPNAVRMGSVGRPIPGVRVEIDRASAEETGAPDGEIVVYGPNVMHGYHNLPDETAKSLTEGGGFRTGDTGRLDEDGFLYITGRIKEQYKLENGKYVAPAPLEEKLKLSPLIANVMVYGHNRAHNVALVVPDFESIDRGKYWSDEKALLSLLFDEVERYSRDFPSYARIKKIAVVKSDFSQANGLITPTMKLKRAVAVKKFKKILDKLYS